MKSTVVVVVLNVYICNVPSITEFTGENDNKHVYKFKI